MAEAAKDDAEEVAPDGGAFTLHIYPPQGTPVVKPLDREMLVGRDPICDVVLDHPTVSGNHALLAPKGSSVAITDLNSTNGTIVDESTAKPEIWTRQSAVVRIGAFRLDLIARKDRPRQVTTKIVSQGVELDQRDKELVSILMKDWTDPSVRVPAASSATELAEGLHCSRQEVNRRIKRLERKLAFETEARGPRRYRDLTEELLRRGLQPGPA